jgi:hypothetical protein
MSRSLKSYVAMGGLAAVVVAAAASPAAHGFAPCAPGTEMPTITAQDFEAGSGGTLTATHTIDLEANFSDGSSRDDFQASAPPGVNVRSGGPNGVRLVSDAAGALPITLTWTEHPLGADDCTASTSTTLQLQAPTPLTFGKLPRSLRPKALKHHGKYFAGGYAVTAAIGRYTDRRPVELRLRGIARRRLPSPSMPFKVVTASLRTLDPGLGSTRYLRSPKWQVTGRTNFQGTAFFLEARMKTGSVHNHPVGYELQVLQAGRLMLRVREAGTCNLGGCIWRIMKVQGGS